MCSGTLAVALMQASYPVACPVRLDTSSYCWAYGSLRGGSIPFTGGWGCKGLVALGLFRGEEFGLYWPIVELAVNEFLIFSS